MENCHWKENWSETREHLMGWWAQSDFVIGKWGGVPLSSPHPLGIPAPRPLKDEAYFLGGAKRAELDLQKMAGQAFPGDIVPIIDPELGPGSLHVHLGGEARLKSGESIWFDPAWAEIDDVEDIPAIRFTGEDPYWQATEAWYKRMLELYDASFFLGVPDLCPGLDILSSLRDPNLLLMDMLEEPEWVHASLDAIETAYQEVFGRIQAMVDPDGTRGMASRSFYIWGPGRVAKQQCDASVMISEDMFREFELPRLRKRCQSMDYSLYHLDGTDAIRHLDALLEIDELHAIEWTPEAGKPGGADPLWHDMYRKVLDAGKSLQIVYIKPEEVLPLFNAVGHKGLYVMPDFETVEQVETLMRSTEHLRI